MKRWIIVIMCLVATAISQHGYGSSIKGDVELFIVGTIHHPTEEYTVDDLVAILKTTKPDLILHEFDSNLFNAFFDEANSFDLDRYEDFIKKSGKGKYTNYKKYRCLECDATVEYQKIANFDNRPFDIEGRNEYYEANDFSKLEREYGEAFNKEYDKLTSDLKEWAILQSAFFKIKDLQPNTPRSINSNGRDEIIKYYQYYYDFVNEKLVAQVPKLEKYSRYIELYTEFWIKRNDTMVDNILKYLREGKWRRVVVLCGYQHRYYLRERLLKQQKRYGFRLREYWEVHTH